MIRRAGAILLLLGAFSLGGPAPEAVAQDTLSRPSDEEVDETKKKTGPKQEKKSPVPFLFASFLITWVAIGGYLIAIHRGQKRLEKTLERLEKGT